MLGIEQIEQLLHRWLKYTKIVYEEDYGLYVQYIVAGQEKPHMCIWPLNMYLLQNIRGELSEISFIHVPGTQLY